MQKNLSKGFKQMNNNISSIYIHNSYGDGYGSGDGSG